MSDSFHPVDDSRPVIERLLDDAWADPDEDSAEREKLVAHLEGDPAAREYLLERAMLHVRLRHSLRRRGLATWAVDGSQRGAVKWSRRSVLAWFSAACCVALAIGGGLFASRPYATVRVGIGTAGLPSGRGMWSEPHELAAGVLELETRKGATVVIEAPAVFRFETPQRLMLSRGRVSAEVPAPAKGFTVVTPSGEAIDLGTRFAVDVPVSGAAEVHVFDGEVVAHGTARPPKNVKDGEAFSLAMNESRDLRTAAFIRGSEIPGLAAAVEAGQEGVARTASRRLHDDPALIAVIDLEDDLHKSVSEVPGQYRLVQGRWPGSRSADFTNLGDHLPVDVGGESDWPQLTVAAWVRLDRLGEPFQSLYHTDGWTLQNPGQIHWMIVDTGVMRLALPGLVLDPQAVERYAQPESRTSVLGTEGRWMHLAFVYDSEARTASFYVDGRPDGVTMLAEAPPARLGPARVGNWNASDRKLSGRLDEIVLLGRCLTADEVRLLFEAGVPYR
jgi:hypothetical protein